MTQTNIQADLTPYLCSQVCVSVTTLSSLMQHGIKIVRLWEKETQTATYITT